MSYVLFLDEWDTVDTLYSVSSEYSLDVCRLNIDAILDIQTFFRNNCFELCSTILKSGIP
jgi:hypothetical protein